MSTAEFVGTLLVLVTIFALTYLGTITRRQRFDPGATKAIGQATRVIMAKLATMEKKMQSLDELLDAVAAQQTKIDSLITLTDSLHQAVLDAMGDTITPSQAMRIAQVFDAVKQNSSDIDAALTANTVDATKGAVSDGPSAADIKAGTNLGDGAATVGGIDPGPAIGSTDGGIPATN